MCKHILLLFVSWLLFANTINAEGPIQINASVTVSDCNSVSISIAPRGGSGDYNVYIYYNSYNDLLFMFNITEGYWGADNLGTGTYYISVVDDPYDGYETTDTFAIPSPCSQIKVTVSVTDGQNNEFCSRMGYIWIDSITGGDTQDSGKYYTAYVNGFEDTTFNSSDLPLELANPYSSGSAFLEITEEGLDGAYSYAGYVTIPEPSVLIVSDTAKICKGNTYSFNGMELDSTGIYSDTAQTVTGCDSVTILHLTVFDTSRVIVYDSTCANAPYLFGNDTLTAAGEYFRTLPNMNGCDSLVDLHLMVLPTPDTSLSATICSNELYLFGSDTLIASGNYALWLTNINGCDSVINLQLTVDSINASISQLSWDSLMVTGNGTIQWINCSTGMPISGETGNIFSTQIQGSYGAAVTSGYCTDTTACLEILVTGTRIMADNALQIFPNPAINYLVLQVIGPQPDWITIYNTAGQKISEMKFAPVIDISMLASGVYFVEVGSGGIVYRNKVVKM